MHLLARGGKVVLLVSHRIAELSRHADRVALIIDGVCTDVLEGDALTQEGIADGLVTGEAHREPDERDAAHLTADAPTTLRLDAWTHGGDEFSGIELQVQAGEIVALVGVEGSGRGSSCDRSLASNARLAASKSPVGTDSPRLAPARAWCRRSGDQPVRQPVRRRQPRLASGSRDRDGRRRASAPAYAGIASELRDRFQVKASSIDLPVRSLSGGNQQKWRSPPRS